HGAQVADRRLQDRFADELVAPYVIEQLVLGQQRAGSSRQRAEQPEGPRRESDRDSIARQPCIRLVELECAEAHAYRVRGSPFGARSGASLLRQAERNDSGSVHFDLRDESPMKRLATSGGLLRARGESQQTLGTTVGEAVRLHAAN